MIRQRVLEMDAMQSILMNGIREQSLQSRPVRQQENEYIIVAMEKMEFVQSQKQKLYKNLDIGMY